MTWFAVTSFTCAVACEKSTGEDNHHSYQHVALPQSNQRISRRVCSRILISLYLSPLGTQCTVHSTQCTLPPPPGHPLVTQSHTYAIMTVPPPSPGRCIGNIIKFRYFPAIHCVHSVTAHFLSFKPAFLMSLGEKLQQMLYLQMLLIYIVT